MHPFTYASLLSSTSWRALSAPDDDLGGGDDDPFAERPGDREEPGEPVHSIGDEDGGDGAVDEEAEGDAGEGDAADGESEGEAGDDTEAKAEGDPDAEGDPTDEPAPRKDWRARQLEKRNKQLEDLRAEKADLERRLEATQALYARDEDGNPITPLVTKDEAVRIAKEEVKREESFNRLNSAADRVFNDGKAKYGADWDERITTTNELFGDTLPTRLDIIESIMDEENATDLYYHLSGDPDEMERILNLPPHKMGAEVAKMAAKLREEAKPKPKQLSKVPPPIKPLGRSGGDERDPTDVMNDPNATREQIDRASKAIAKAAAANRAR